ncbi:MAG: mechanosensitive ion channel family protein [Candidatus Bathyarchaeia archaeon]
MVEFLGIDIIRWLELALAIAGTLIAAYVASWLTARILEKSGSPAENIKKSRRMAKYAVYVMGAVVTLFYFAFDIIGALVGLGIFGIAVGIGLGTVLGNIVGGVVVLLDKSFRLGDEIRVGNFEGKVVKVGIQRVVLEGKDGNAIFVPTIFFLSNPVSRKCGDFKPTECKD